MRYNPVIATVTIAVGALALVGAIIWQVVHDKQVDVYIGTLVGTLFGAFLQTPAATGQVEIRQPAGNPVPVDTTPDRGAVNVVWLAAVVVIICGIVWLVANVDVSV